MRVLMIATAALSLGTADAALAQHMGGHATTRGPDAHIAPRQTMDRQRQDWGPRIGGRWHGGSRAPGGWNAYRRPVRGVALPTYWTQPGWSIGNWSGYGLPQPPSAYGWSRYYDDAVLIDRRGSVYDSVQGVDWDGMSGGDRYAYTPGDDDRYREEYRDRRDADGYRGDRDRGVGGAVIGGVAGGVAGNLIAGRGNRLAGTVIGAGVGAAAGYAVDKEEDRRRAPPHYGAGYARPGYDEGYAEPGYPEPGYNDDYPMRDEPGYAGHGGTVVTTSTGGNARTYYYPAGSTTTITIASAPVVTTTVTETYEDVVTYSKPTYRKSYKRAYKPRSKTKCRC